MLIDADDYDLVCSMSWEAHRKNSGSDSYRVRSTKRGGQTYLHRFILRPPTDIQVDHINHDSLDNRRSNLRICTLAQNCMNSAKRGGSSRYKGVYFYKKTSKWAARIKSFGKTIYLGYFTEEVDAARAYNRAAEILYKDFANPNIIEP